MSEKQLIQAALENQSNKDQFLLSWPPHEAQR